MIPMNYSIWLNLSEASWKWMKCKSRQMRFKKILIFKPLWNAITMCTNTNAYAAIWIESNKCESHIRMTTAYGGIDANYLSIFKCGDDWELWKKKTRAKESLTRAPICVPFYVFKQGGHGCAMRIVNAWIF